MISWDLEIAHKTEQKISKIQIFWLKSLNLLYNKTKIFALNSFSSYILY